MAICPVCKLAPGTILGWFAAPDCPPRGLRLICRTCGEAAQSRRVPDYVFHSADASQAGRLLSEFTWAEDERRLLLHLLN